MSRTSHDRGTIYSLQRTIWLLAPRRAIPVAAVAASDPPLDETSFAACITVRGIELVIEAPGVEAFDVVRHALEAARGAAGFRSRLEGPHRVEALSPPICYGKLRFSNRDLDLLRRGLDGACNAATLVFLEGGYRRLP